MVGSGYASPESVWGITMDKRRYGQIERGLDREEARLRTLLEALKERGFTRTESESVGELSSYDQHTADQGSETYEREKDLGLFLGTSEQLEQVHRARTRLRSGEYGICEECGQEIDAERLDALPTAMLCVACKAEQEEADDSSWRPVEEDVLSPPFGRSDDPESAAFDGLDTWQSLAVYGTANSPQDVPQDDIGDGTDGVMGEGPLADLDSSLWGYIQEQFPGDPEAEMAAELAPDDMAEIARDYQRSEWDMRRRRGQDGRNDGPRV